MDLKLTNEEEIILTSIIVDLSEGNKIPVTNENILHELIKRARYYETVEEIKRICRKTEYNAKQISITDKAYIKSYGLEKIESLLRI